MCNYRINLPGQCLSQSFILPTSLAPLQDLRQFSSDHRMTLWMPSSREWNRTQKPSGSGGARKLHCMTTLTGPCAVQDLRAQDNESHQLHTIITACECGNFITRDRKSILKIYLQYIFGYHILGDSMVNYCSLVMCYNTLTGRKMSCLRLPKPFSSLQKIWVCMTN